MDYSPFKKHMKDIIEFWTPAVDWKNGGIHFRMKDFGKGPLRLKNKNLLMHCRQLYDFSAAAEMKMNGGARIARHLYKTLDRLFLDRKNGLYITRSAWRHWQDSGEFRSAYDNYYSVVGMARFAMAFGDRPAYQKAKDHFFHTRKHFLHGKKYQDNGCYSGWNSRTRKFFDKAGNTMLHHLEAVTDLALTAQKLFTGKILEKEMAALKPVLLESYQLFVRKIYHPAIPGTIEEFNEHMKPTIEQMTGYVSNAHALEWFGFFHEASLATGLDFPFWREKGRKLVDAVLKRSVDPNGYFHDRHFVLPKKSWGGGVFWTQVESTLAAFYAHSIFRNKKYKDYGGRLARFYFSFFVDKKYGGVFSSVAPQGFATDRTKGVPYKCDHHSFRMCEKITGYRLMDRHA